MSTKRKPPARVTGINEARSLDEITDADCERLASLQAAAWSTQKVAADAAGAIERRMRMGAKFKASAWYWDAELKMVRSVKGKAVSE